MSWLTWGNIGGWKSLSNEVKCLSAEIKELKNKVEPQSDSVSALGLLDALFLDEETIAQIKNIVGAIDPEKIKAVMSAIQDDDNGTLQLKIDLSLIKGQQNGTV